MRVVGQGGDGGTVDIGFGCLSGMFERNDDVLFICYDNEAYMNTGVQRSGATPPAARTATTKPVGDEPGNVFGQGKNVPLIAMAHEIPYVATATVADLRDLEAKVERAMEFRGARYMHVFVPCPLGWGSASRDTIRLARLAKETGLFPVFEAEHGEVVERRRRSAGRVPVEEYLKLQRRYAHLFGDPTPTHRRASRASRRSPTATSARFGAARDDPQMASAVMDKPFAITLDVGSSLANKTGTLAHRARRSTSTGCRRATTPARPARTSRRWLYHAEEGGGGYERAWRKLMEDNPFPAIMGRVCYHPCETACNRGQLDEAVGINSVERFLGDEAIRQGWTVRARRARRPASACWSSAPGPSGLVRRLPPGARSATR